MLLEPGDLFDVRLPAYLIGLVGAPENRLVLTIEEATGLGPVQPGQVALGDATEDVLENMLGNSRAIERGPGDRVIEVIWERPVAFAVTDESFAGPERDGEPAAGRVARLVEGSWFDDFVSTSTFADADYPGPLRHYSIVTLNHVVNVISDTEPHLRLVHVHGASSA